MLIIKLLNVYLYSGTNTSIGRMRVPFSLSKT